MATLIIDPDLENRVREARKLSGGDRYDEVWEGVYIMAPLANNEHQELALDIALALRLATRPMGARVAQGANVSNDPVNWERNYRCPDVVVFLPDTTADDQKTHWFGGPDLAVEIVSRGDKSRDKFKFYASVNTREVLIVDRFPWSLELFRLREGVFEPIGKSIDPSVQLQSEVAPVHFHLAPGAMRPQVVITHRDTGQVWTA
jgi:Uma2 family endonuclease